MEKNQKDIIKCDICGEEADNLCFKFIHEKNRNKNHKKEKIDSFISFPLKCPDHPKDRINLFCVNEKGN